jgi:hypothetical protein
MTSVSYINMYIDFGSFNDFLRQDLPVLKWNYAIFIPIFNLSDMIPTKIQLMLFAGHISDCKTRGNNEALRICDNFWDIHANYGTNAIISFSEAY